MSMLPNSNPVGVFSLTHFIYLIVSLALITIITIIVYRKKLDIKTQDRINRCVAWAVLIVMTIYRLYIPIGYLIVDHNDSYNWWIILPNGLCGVTCMGLAIAAAIKPRNNITYHCFIYLVIFGTLLTLIYPVAYYKDYAFFHIYGFFGMLYHALSLLLCCLLIATKSFKPELKKWWVMPVGYAAIIIFGVIELYVMGIPEAMNITKPMIEQLPILSGWYGTGIAATLATLIFLLIYNLVSKKNKK